MSDGIKRDGGGAGRNELGSEDCTSEPTTSKSNDHMSLHMFFFALNSRHSVVKLLSL